MKRALAPILAMLAILLAVASPASAQSSGARVASAVEACTDYGSGCWGGPTTSVIQDSGWASPSLEWGIVGDSIPYRCAAPIRSAFAARGLSMAIRAHAGQNIDGSLDWYQTLTYKPNKTIFLVGTNDVFNPYAVPAQITRAKSLAASGGSDVFWGDTYVGRSAWLLSDIRNSGQVNGYIRAQIPDGHVADFVSALTAAHGRGVDAEGTYLADGVHYKSLAVNGTDIGCNFYVATLMAMVDANS